MDMFGEWKTNATPHVGKESSRIPEKDQTTTNLE
jgi:hypothetical protein